MSQRTQQNRLALDMWALRHQSTPEFQAKRLNRPDLPNGWNYQCSIEGEVGHCSLWPISPTIFENFLRIIGTPKGHDGKFKVHLFGPSKTVTGPDQRLLTLWAQGFDHEHQFAIGTLLRTYRINLEIEFMEDHPDASKYAFSRFPIRTHMPIKYQPCTAPRRACASTRTAFENSHYG